MSKFVGALKYWGPRCPDGPALNLTLGTGYSLEHDQLPQPDSKYEIDIQTHEVCDKKTTTKATDTLLWCDNTFSWYKFKP